MVHDSSSEDERNSNNVANIFMLAWTENPPFIETIWVGVEGVK